MSSKLNNTATKEVGQHALVPKLRFQEFRDAVGWGMRSIDQLGEVVTGSTPSTALPEYYGGDKLFVSPADISYGRYVEKTKTTLSALGFSQTRPVKANSILFSCIGTIGKIAQNRQECATNQQINSVIPYPSVSDGFAYYALCMSVGKIADLAGKQTIPIVNKSLFSSVELAVPKLPEQQKIADCLSSLDELIAAQARKVDALKTHKKGLMQQLFPREGETQPRLRFPEFQNDPDWKEERLADLFHFQDGFAFKSTDFVKSKEDATQVVRITDINNKNTNEDKVYLPNAFLVSSKLNRYVVEDGDLLLSLTGAAGFNFFFWNGGRALINQRTAKVTSKKESSPALAQLLERMIHEKINARGEGQNNNLTKDFLDSVVLFLPSLDEQKKIAGCLSSLEDRITSEAQTLEALKTHKKGLMQQLFPSVEAVET